MLGVGQKQALVPTSPPQQDPHSTRTTTSTKDPTRTDTTNGCANSLTAMKTLRICSIMSSLQLTWTTSHHVKKCRGSVCRQFRKRPHCGYLHGHDIAITRIRRRRDRRRGGGSGRCCCITGGAAVVFVHHRTAFCRTRVDSVDERRVLPTGDPNRVPHHRGQGGDDGARPHKHWY